MIIGRIRTGWFVFPFSRSLVFFWRMLRRRGALFLDFSRRMVLFFFLISFFFRVFRLLRFGFLFREEEPQNKKKSKHT